MHKQLQANSKFLMGLYPRELIPLFQLPYSLGVLIIVVRYIHTHPTHTTSTYIYTPNTYHIRTHIHVSHTHTAYSHIRIHSVHHTHTHTPHNTMQHIPHITHATCAHRHTHIYYMPHVPHPHTYHTTQNHTTPSAARYQGTSLCSYTRLLTCGTTRDIIS